jgi:7-alpha-hydroxysteroid dehydrogenase
MQKNYLTLREKTAVVTGGGNGIGKASCEMLAAYGANVVVSDLKLEDAERAAEEINSNGGNAIAVACNVTIDDDLVNLVNVTKEKFGSLEILVNNAGGGGGGRENPFKIDVERFKWVFDLNLFSAWRLTQLCAPEMQKKWLRIGYKYYIYGIHQ